MAVSDDFTDYDDDGEEEDPAAVAAAEAERAAANAAIAAAEVAANAEARATIDAALALHARDAAAGERALIEALYALGGDMRLHMAKVRARPLMLALFELATPDAIDAALQYAVGVNMPDNLPLSEAAWTAVVERLALLLPAWDPPRVVPLLWNLVRPLLRAKRATEPLLVLLCAIIDDARVSPLERDHMVTEILARIDVDDPLYLFSTPADMRARYRAALAARAGDTSLAPAPIARGLLLGDPAEAYVELAVRYREDAQWRKAIAENINGKADPRFVDEAVRVASIDPASATRTLGRMRTPRALEELLHWADTAGDGGPFDVLVRYAIHALGEARATIATPAIVRWIERRDLGDVTAILFQSLVLTARREHLPLLDTLGESPHAARYAALAERLRRS